MEDTLRRIKKAVNWLIYCEIAENEKELAERLGYTKSSFSQIVNGRVPLSDKFIKNLCSLDGNINDVWIKSGTGEMFRDGVRISQKVYGDNNHVAGHDINISSSDVSKLIETVNSQQRSIAELVQTSQAQMSKFIEMIDRLTTTNK